MSLTDPPILGLAALGWARRWHVPFVFLCQDIFPEVATLLEDFRSDRVNRALDRVNRLLLRRADAVVAIGETMADRLIAKGADPARITVIHNWADRATLGAGAEEEPIRRGPRAGRPVRRAPLREPRAEPGTRASGGRGSYAA